MAGKREESISQQPPQKTATELLTEFLIEHRIVLSVEPFDRENIRFVDDGSVILGRPQFRAKFAEQ